MRSLMCLNATAILAMACTASLASAQLVPDIPVPSDGPLPMPQVAPIVPPTLAPIVPLRPMTVAEFSAAFKPLPGHYEVMLIHPKTGCPVKVCFTLPPGCLRKVRVNAHRIVFDYKRQHDVVIRFFHSGRVAVRD